MTVIIAARFDEKNAVMIADERSSTQVRQFDIARKLHTVRTEGGVHAVFGGTGVSDRLYECAIRFIDDIADKDGRPDIKFGWQLASALDQQLKLVRHEMIDGELLRKYGLTRDNFLRGLFTDQRGNTGPINESWVVDYKRMVEGEHPIVKELANQFLCLSYDSKGRLCIHSTDMLSGKPYLVARPFETAGSGSDLAQVVLSDFYGTASRDNNYIVDKCEGVLAAVSSANAAAKGNIGVGGTPYIQPLVDGKLEDCLSDAESRLVAEIAKGHDKKLLGTDFAKQAVNDLVYERKTASSVEEEMWRRTTNKEGLSRLLRGYKN
ncbi:hypothetical protein COV18_04495 [Candidatus Woesearchaeota archaeon CG10_big_fil_rev_8_21_14_0_10_37_12]|nr:MAG: hypothetical protein COV18_04495 [Candidatus Woesearchaeota archaeon CG10_big_fil_rev_8_21_14_0_10_37_12]